MDNTKDNKVLQIPIEEIIPNRFQPRLSFDEKSLQELASSIKQHGIIQPLVLRNIGDKYEIIAGERRYKAAKMAGLISVPAIITDMSDSKSAEVAIIENIQRKDLTAIEEARSYQTLLDKENLTQEELAKKMGISQSAISNKLRLLQLDEQVQKAILEEKISERHARSLLKIKDKKIQKQILDRIIKERLTVRQLEEEIKKMGDFKNDKDVPVIKTTDINSIMQNATDIETKKDDDIKEIEEVKVVDPNNIFNSANNMPNKFFNFLEDEAANMNMTEEKVDYKVPEKEKKINYQELLNQTDDIEMLDDFIIPSVKEDKTVTEDDYLSGIIKTIRDLNLDKDKVSIEEMNLPNEYHINIKIKKDKL